MDEVAMNENTKKIDALYSLLVAELSSDLTEELQQELVDLVVLLPELRRTENSQLVGHAEIAAKALLCEKPNLNLAKGLREDISNRLSINRNPLKAVFRGATPSTRVILGLGLLIYIVIPLLVVLWPWLSDQKEIFGLDASMLGLVIISGALGSIVSILVRIHDFSELKGDDPAVMFLTGFFKPVIGISFALFVYAILKAGLIPITINEGGEKFFFVALSFVTGFSERFARDVVTRTESTIPN